MKDNNSHTDQPAEEQLPSDETQPKLREISEEELKQILEEHKKWLESDGEAGEQADLRKANLKKAYLGGANLQKADIWNANLQSANLSKANLRTVTVI